ncbi:MAG TPA: alpha/beta hydrolase [Anaeromyxobacteraceae bacterium]|nr:alpha/beta hydrolase [Anaeromyxobacteraceae bacterium]
MPEDVRFPARDGRLLTGTVFASDRPCGSVVVASAMAVRRRLYAPFAEHLARGGLTTLTFDYRSIGDSRDRPLRQCKARLHDWGELDLAGAFDWMLHQHPTLPLQLAAHSLGGQLFGLIENAPVAGAVFVASQSGSWKHWRGLLRLLLFASWHVLLPSFAWVLGYIPMKFFGQGEDLPGGVGAEWARWGRHDDYVGCYAQPRGGMNFAHWSGPLCSYSISDDSYAPRSSVEALLAMYTRADTELRVICPRDVGANRVGHFDVFRPRFRHTIWSEIRNTLLSRLPAGMVSVGDVPAD